MYGVGSLGLDPPYGVNDAYLTFDLDLVQETRHRTEQAATTAAVPGEIIYACFTIMDLLNTVTYMLMWKYDMSSKNQ